MKRKLTPTLRTLAVVVALLCSVTAALSVWASDFEADVEAGVAAYENGDYVRALELWRPLAEQGHARAQFWVGHMYRTGRSVEKDVAEALKWFRRAAEQEDVMAEYILGVLYYVGDDVPKDFAQAADWLRRAAEHGDIDALAWLAEMYNEGEWVPEDTQEARLWFQQVVQHLRQKGMGGNPDTMYTWAKTLLKGGLIAADPMEARRWFQKAIHHYRSAATRDDIHAQCKLSVMYAYGQGVQQSQGDASTWFTRAAAQQQKMPCFKEYASSGDPDAWKTWFAMSGMITMKPR